MNDRPSERQATFDAMFAEDPDPWSFETSTYEQEKRRATMAALGDNPFARAFEPGCANGFLTELLAPSCGHLLAMDVSPRALELAEERLQGSPHVSFEVGEIPGDWPGGTFDLIVLSEILYFLDPEEIASVSALARKTLRKRGTCLLVNWTGESDLPVDGDGAVRIFADSAEWSVTSSAKHDRYRIDLFAAA
ncbi:class I SAM-dependent DNA methyltransferase [Erythrobacter sp.]|uniref:class I SAM-dependent DNA methyltransferase n=1 Tax=Erythrobacter sp. TaxID=1042 RepID=UPI003C7363AC